jgi:two-component system, NarL family, response regulator NreC
MADKRIRVLIADDHDIVRRSISALLKREDDLEVVGTAANGREAVRLAEETHPDVIILDVVMPELDGIRAAGEIHKSNSSTSIIILSMHYSTALVQQARESGASGYVLKQEATSNLIPAVRAAHEGRLSL